MVPVMVSFYEGKHVRLSSYIVKKGRTATVRYYNFALYATSDAVLWTMTNSDLSNNAPWVMMGIL